MITIHNDSHLDHDIPEDVRAAIVDQLNARDLPSFIILTLEHPSPVIPCGLHGPIMGDAPITEAETVYERRGNRAYVSRLCSRAPRLQRKVTVIIGEHDGTAHVLYTMFGGPLAPKEPADPTLVEREREESVAFWREHALSKGA
jgi:hypothetical protein